MSNYIVRDVKFLCQWAWTYFPWYMTRRRPGMASLLRRGYWKQITEDGWFLGWPLWFGKKRGKG